MLICPRVVFLRLPLAVSALLTVLPIASLPVLAQINVPTERYDQSRLGANLQENQLTTSNVNVNTFGKLWSYPVSGSVQAQPLYIQNVTIPGKGTHNVLYVATMNDVVYAFDADSSSTTPLLSLDLTTEVPGSIPVPITDIVGSGLNVVGNVGITSTPHIDTTTNTLYLVARTRENASACGSVNGTYCQRLHALDITTFAEKFGGPVVIQGSVPGNGNVSQNGTLTFDPKIHNQRASLAMANGQIFIGWASHEDQNPYHGWVMAYNATTLKQTGIWSSTPDGAEGGIWMAGHGPVVDSASNVYYVVGNGDWNGTRNFGEALVKFGSTTGMPLLDWFTPSDWNSLNGGDVDYGATGPMLLPGTDLILSGGKESVFYLSHTGNLGHEQSGDGQIVQSFSNHGGQLKGGAVYWNRSGGAGPWMYAWSDNCDHLKAYHFNGTTFDIAVISESTLTSPCGSSGGVLALSANGSTAGSGIVWSSMPLSDDGDHGVHQGVLRALNADDVSKELWNSRLNATRDDSGNWPKFSPPTVVNGRVYLASFPADGVGSSVVNVFGLLASNPNFSLAATPVNQGVKPGGTVSYTVSTSSLGSFAGSVALSVAGLPSGATGTFASSNIATPGSTTLTVATGAGTPVGSNTLTITGTSGSLVHTASVGLQVTSGAAGPNAISIDFVGRGTAMGASEVAGVVAKSHWNDATGSTGSGFSLVDETGVASGTTAAWSSSPGWSLGIADTAGNNRMMNGYLDTVSQNTTVSVSGLLPSSAGYDVYVYADGDNGPSARSATYQLSGSGFTTTSVSLTDAANTNFSGTFTPANNNAGNYVLFSAINATGFTLTAIPGTAADGTARAPINGVQIVPHVAPANFSLSVSPASASVIAGRTAAFQVTATASNNFSGPVALAASGLPAGATASFSPASISGAGTSTLTITTAGTTPSSASTITITGTSGSLTHSAPATLQVSSFLSHAGWTLKYVDSQETSGENGAAANAFDGNQNTIWHSQWSGANPPPPHEIQINLGASNSLSGFSYLPRQDNCSHGDIKQFEFYVSSDGVNWGSPVASGTFSYGNNFVYGCPGGTNGAAQVISFPAVKGAYVRLRALSEMGGNAWTSAAEINVLH